MLLVLTTFPDLESARAVAGRLLDERLAACVSLMSAVESHYEWEGERQCATEVPVLIKTSEEAYGRMEDRLREWHPYEVPEIVAVASARVLERYAAWVREMTPG